MVTEAFRIALLHYRARGGRLYQLANDHGLSPSLFSATVSGARRCSYDPRVVAVGQALGLKPDQVFVDEEEAEPVDPRATVDANSGEAR